MNPVIYKGRVYEPVALPPQAKDESFTSYELADGAKLARDLKKYLNRRVILTGGGGWGYWPCILRGVTIERRYRCMRDANGCVVRDPKRLGKTDRRGGAADWIPRKDLPKIATVTVILAGNKALPTRHPFIGSWMILIPTKKRVNDSRSDG